MKKKSAATANAIQQAELILKLYELRREAVMREARYYVGGDFLPASAEEFIQIVSAGDRHSSFVLQVYGYWEMVAAFVTSGALDAELLYNTCPEMYFQYAKIQPYLEQFREEMDMPEFLINIKQLIEGSRTGRKRIEAMQKNLLAIADARSRSASKSQTTLKSQTQSKSQTKSKSPTKSKPRAKR